MTAKIVTLLHAVARQHEAAGDAPALPTWNEQVHTLALASHQQGFQAGEREGFKAGTRWGILVDAGLASMVAAAAAATFLGVPRLWP